MGSDAMASQTPRRRAPALPTASPVAQATGESRRPSKVRGGGLSPVALPVHGPVVPSREMEVPPAAGTSAPSWGRVCFALTELRRGEPLTLATADWVSGSLL